jgi:hypothetical protein
MPAGYVTIPIYLEGGSILKIIIHGDTMSKLTVFVAASTLAASLGAYAAVPTGAAPFQVVVPNLKSGVEFTLEGLYLQPSNSDLDYATSFTSVSGTNTLSQSANISTVDPDYDLGFRIGLGYVFPDSGNDVQASWTHFSHSSDDSVGFAGDGFGVATRSGSSFDGNATGDALSANSSADFKYDAIDLDVGQYLSIGTRLQTRLFAGLRYAQVKNDLTDNYAGVSTSDVKFVYTQSEVYNSKFTGIGPRFGVDAAYHVGNCFGVVGHVAAALLVGRVESSSSLGYYQLNTGATTPSTSSFSTTSDNQTRVVPAFDAKLGFDYSIPFNNDASRLTFELGYQATQYVDAIDRLGVGDSAGSRTTSGVGFNGPYLNLNYKM